MIDIPWQAGFAKRPLRGIFSRNSVEKSRNPPA